MDLNEIHVDQGYIHQFSDREITVTVDVQIAGILHTQLVLGRVHPNDTINSFLVDTLCVPGFSRTLIRKDLVPKILDSLGRHLDGSHRSSMIVARGSRGEILGMV